MFAAWKESYDKSSQHFKKQKYHFADKCPYSQSYGFSSSHIWMWELDHNEGWLLKNWCFQIVALEKTLESPFNSKEITSVNTKGNHPKFNPKYSLEGFMLRLWYFCHLMWRVYSVKRAWCWERLKAKGKGGGRGWDG